MKPWLLLLASSAILQAEPYEGDVIDSVTGAPIAGAYVISRSGEKASAAVSDSSGHFRASQPVTALVYRTGFLPGMALPIEGSSSLRAVLTPEAVISGKVVDEDGFPAEGVSVQAMRFRIVQGQRKLQTVGFFGQTNDLGEYRIAGLPAGRYYLREVAWGRPAAWDRHYTTQYYPGTLDQAEASVIELKAGQERGVNIQLTRHMGASVAGQVLLPPGVATGTPVFLTLDAPGPPGGPLPWIKRADGSFVFPVVPPGSYVLRARIGNYVAQAGDLLAEQAVEVGSADVRGLVLALCTVEPVDLPGTVVFEGGAQPRPMLIGISGRPGGTVPVRMNDDGSFVAKGLVPGRYVMNTTPGPSAAPAAPVLVSSVRLGDRELSPDSSSTFGFDFDGTSTGPLRIAFSSGVAISGTLVDAAGGPIAGAWIRFLPSQGQSYGAPPTKADGSFRSWFLLPGDYRVYLLPAGSSWELVQDPDFLAAHEKDFPPLHVVPGANPPLTLRVPAQ